METWENRLMPPTKLFNYEKINQEKRFVILKTFPFLQNRRIIPYNCPRTCKILCIIRFKIVQMSKIEGRLLEVFRMELYSRT